MFYQTAGKDEKPFAYHSGSEIKGNETGIGVSVVERLLSAMDEINRKSDSITLKLAAALAEARQDARAGKHRDDKDAWQIAFARLY